MIVIHIHNGIKYFLSNENLKKNDLVFPLTYGKCENDGTYTIYSIDFDKVSSSFPDDPHKILTTKYSDYKPYQVHTSHGYGPIEMYFKIIKTEKVRVELEYCPVCGEGNPLHEIEHNRHACDHCKRVWGVTPEGDVISEVRTVTLKKQPEIGDHMDDVFEPQE
jgi:ribosomal protein S27AE